jgi:RimJ/RimL family protein N-acetyltransferase
MNGLSNTKLVAFDKEMMLETDRVIVRPIALSDVEEFATIATEPSLWLYTPTLINSPEKVKGYVEAGVRDWDAKTRMMLVIISKESNKIVGSTSIGSIAFEHQRAEIGWTWLHPDIQGTGLNKECKFLLLNFCFDHLDLVRVEFKTDVDNVKSRKAMLKIGCTEEGTLRSHTLLNNGRRRDSVYYSILNNEWPEIRNSIFVNY